MKFSKATAVCASLLPLVAAKDCRPNVESEKLQKLITQDGLMNNLKELEKIAAANGGNRAFGLPGYTASVEYIHGEVSKLKNMNSWIQDFPALFTQTKKAEVTIGGETFRTVALTYTPSTPEEGVTLEVVHAPEGKDACSADKYTGIDSKGKIVLVERGLCPDSTTFAGKVKAAAKAGAAAVILYNSDPAKLTAGSLSAPNPAEYVPAALIDQEPGQALKKRLAAGEKVEARATIVQLIEERITQNVFVETKGGDASNLVVLGAHLDSVQAGAGINDDGSGTTLILEIAKALSKFKTNLKVRFGWWGAEENGLWGSKFYVNKQTQQEVDDLLLYMNFDMVSRGYYGVFDGKGDKEAPGGPAGSDTIENLFIDYFTDKGIETTPVGLTGGSDYVPFLQVLKKPVGGLFTGAETKQDDCYHQVCDNINNANPEILTNNAKAAAHVLSILAMDGAELIPKAPANVTGAIKREFDPITLEIRDSLAGHGKQCDHDII